MSPDNLLRSATGSMGIAVESELGAGEKRGGARSSVD